MFLFECVELFRDCLLLLEASQELNPEVRPLIHHFAFGVFLHLFIQGCELVAQSSLFNFISFLFLIENFHFVGVFFLQLVATKIEAIVKTFVTIGWRAVGMIEEVDQLREIHFPNRIKNLVFSAILQWIVREEELQLQLRRDFNVEDQFRAEDFTEGGVGLAVFVDAVLN